MSLPRPRWCPTRSHALSGRLSVRGAAGAARVPQGPLWALGVSREPRFVYSVRRLSFSCSPRFGVALILGLEAVGAFHECRPVGGA